MSSQRSATEAGFATILRTIMAAFDKPGVVLRTKRASLLVGQLALGALLIGLTLRFVTQGDGWFRLSAITLAMTVSLSQAWQRWLRVRRVDMRADATGIYLGGHLAAKRTAILRAHVIRERGTTFVRVVRRVWPLEIFVDSEEEGQRLIAALRLDPAHSLVRLTVSEGTVAWALVRIGVLGLAWLVVSVASATLFVVAGAADRIDGIVGEP